MALERLVKEGTVEHEVSRQKMRARKDLKQIDFLINASDEQIEKHVRDNMKDLETATAFAIRVAKYLRFGLKRLQSVLDPKPGEGPNAAVDS